MSSKTTTKITLDIVMTVLFIILIYAYDTGLVFHEIAGLTIFALFTFHIILNWSWVKNVTKNLFNTRIKTKSKLMYALNVALLISVSTIIITGILISQVIFNFGSDSNNHILVAVHKWFAYACLVLFTFHIALNWRYISVSVRHIFLTLKESTLRKSFQAIGAAALVIVVMYSLIMSSSDKANQQATAINGSSRETTTTRKIDSNRNSEVYEYKATGDQDYTISEDIPENTKDTISLSDYLGKMFCTGCDKHCPLLSLKCDKGNSQLQAAKIQYQKLYGETASN